MELISRSPLLNSLKKFPLLAPIKRSLYKLLIKRHRRVVRDFLKKNPLVVQGGPFLGLKLPTANITSVVPKLVGCYEEELHPIIEKIIHRGYKRVVNIGCAEGYYAVGLAMKIPVTEVYAYDTVPLQQHLCRQSAELNAVSERIIIREQCTTQELETIIVPDTLLVGDCEGCEIQRLDIAQVPSLATCDILVELHDFIAPATSRTLHNRFAETHGITTVEATERSPHQYPQLNFLRKFDRKLALWEKRPPGMQWYFLRVNR